MNKEEIEKVEMLLAKVNAVTAYHRHGNKIPVRRLADLTLYQIEFEQWLKEHTKFVPVDLREAFLNADAKINKTLGKE
jgi:hypothetical protein